MHRSRPALAALAAITCAASLTATAHATTLVRAEPVQVQIDDADTDVWVTEAPAGKTVTDAEKAAAELTDALVVVNANRTRLRVTVHTDGAVGASDHITYYGMFITSAGRDLLVGSTVGGETVLLDTATRKTLPCRGAAGAAADDDAYRVSVPVACLQRAGVTTGRVKAYSLIERSDGVDLVSDFTPKTDKLAFIG